MSNNVDIGRIDNSNNINNYEINSDNDHIKQPMDKHELHDHLSYKSNNKTQIDEPTKRPLGILRTIVVILLLICSMFFTQVGIGAYLVPMREIAKTFNIEGDSGEQSWIIAAHSLTVATFVLPAGRVGDMIGNKKVFLFGFVWYSIWSMITGLTVYTRSIIFFDVCRALQGIAPGIILPNASALISKIFTGKTRLIAFSCMGASAPNGAIISALFASLFAGSHVKAPVEGAEWAWGSFVLAIVLLIIFILSFLFIPDDEKNEEQQQVGFDYLGAFVAVSGLILIVFAWNQSALVTWKNAYVCTLLVVGVLLMAAFVFIEGRVKQPILPLTVFKNIHNNLMLGCIVTGWSTFSIWLFYSIRFLQDLRGVGTLETVSQMVPCSIMGCVAATTSALLLMKAGGSVVMVFALCAFLAACCLIAFQPVHLTYWATTFVSFFIGPFGMDMSFPAASIIISNHLPHEHQGLAGSLVNTLVNYSIALALGIASTVENNVNNGGQDLEKGYRGALYFGVGLAGFGLLMAIANLLIEIYEERRGTSSHHDSEKKLD